MSYFSAAGGRRSSRPVAAGSRFLPRARAAPPPTASSPLSIPPCGICHASSRIIDPPADPHQMVALAASRRPRGDIGRSSFIFAPSSGLTGTACSSSPVKRRQAPDQVRGEVEGGIPPPTVVKEMKAHIAGRMPMASATHLLTEEEATRPSAAGGDGGAFCRRQRRRDAADRRAVHAVDRAGRQRPRHLPRLPGRNPRPAGHDLRRLGVPDQLRLDSRSTPPATSPTCSSR